jgi:hypothetical protein
MPWPVHPNGLLGAQGDNDSYRVERSLRFNSADAAYLNRTPASAGNRKTWTWSGWVKRSGLGTNQGIFTTNGSTNATLFSMRFSSSDTLIIANFALQYLITTQLFRDTSSWFHLVVAFNTTLATSSDRIKVYINGSQVTAFSTTNYPALNDDTGVTDTRAHQIGSEWNVTDFLSSYLSEIHLIDGQALTPSSFGETDAITGRWKAKAYSGTYGTNGFYLKFADNSGTTSTTLGKDSSPNGNNWTPNNFSVTAGAGNDSLVDSPTNYGSDTGLGGEARGNYPVFNSISKNSSVTISDGGLRAAFTNNRFQSVTIPIPSTGKWYAEFTPLNGSSTYSIGLGDISQNADSAYSLLSSSPAISYINNGNKNINGSVTSGGATYTTNDIIGVAVNADLNSVSFYKNNSIQFTVSGSSFSTYSGRWVFGGEASAFSEVLVFNGGQRPFAYTAPTGFKALCTTNLTTPTIKKPSTAMDVVAYTGTGASNSISSLGFSPDLVWIKNRGGATSHAIYDTTRGTQSQLSSDTTGDQVTSSSGLTAFGSNGFTISTSTLVNTTGTQYVAWAWDESTQAGLDVVSYTGNGANRTINHTLGVAPKMVIVKASTTAGADQGWPVWHTSIANTTYLQLNSTSSTAAGTDYWNSSSPTSSAFPVGTNAAVNTSADTYIAYLFAEVEGFSKFGSYTGNSSADGPFVWCGFSPRFVLTKNSSSGGPGYDWVIWDAARNPSNQTAKVVFPDLANAEEETTTIIDILSSGFKLRNSGATTNAGTMIFAAFAESPFKYARAR